MQQHDYQQTTAECVKDRAGIWLGSSQLLDKVTCNEVLLLGTRVAISDSARDLDIIIIIIMIIIKKHYL